MSNTLFEIITIKVDDERKKLVKEYCDLIERIIPRSLYNKIHQINAFYGGFPKYEALIKVGYLSDIAAVHSISYATLYMANITQKEECIEVVDILYPNNSTTIINLLTKDNATIKS